VAPLGRPAWVTFRKFFMHLALDMGRPHYVMHASCVADKMGNAAYHSPHIPQSLFPERAGIMPFIDLLPFRIISVITIPIWTRRYR